MEANPVSLAEVRDWIEVSFQLLERGGVTSVVLDKDFHWEVDVSDSFTVAEPKPVVASLFDDVEELREATRQLREGEYEPVWHYLGHLSGVLKALTKQALDESVCIGLEGSDE